MCKDMSKRLNKPQRINEKKNFFIHSKDCKHRRFQFSATRLITRFDKDMNVSAYGSSKLGNT